MPESAARRRKENAAAERRKARRRAYPAGDLRRSGDRPDREAGHGVRRFRTSACRRSAPPRFWGAETDKAQPTRPYKRAAERWLAGTEPLAPVPDLVGDKLQRGPRV